MIKNNKFVATEWFDKSNDDMAIAQRSLIGRKKITWSACFHSQQSAEKDLKGFLIYHNFVPKRTHDLVELLEECTKIDNSFTFIKPLVKELMPYSVQTRYPAELIFTITQAKRAINAAMQIK